MKQKLKTHCVTDRLKDQCCLLDKFIGCHVTSETLVFLCVCVCVSDESMQKCFGEGSGVVYQDILSWLQSSNTQLQLSGALAIANFARNGKI